MSKATASRPWAIATYAAYRDDEFLDIGTATELAEKLGVTRDYIQWARTPTSRKRNKKLIVIRIDQEEP